MKHNGRIFITGDIHSTHSIKKLTKKKWKEGSTLTKKDVLIILGDFGLLWDYYRTKEEDFWLKFLDEQSWTTLFLDGNHENHDLLDNLQKKHMFGSEVGIVSHSIFHLLRGEVYCINGKKILTVGGAHSHDREDRAWGKSMWKQEEITEKDIKRAKESINECMNEIDYVLTHCAPPRIAMHCIEGHRLDSYFADGSELWLEYLFEKCGLTYKKHFFGHYHRDGIKDEYEDKWQAVYHNIIEII